jgi:hypothetical protein
VTVSAYTTALAHVPVSTLNLTTEEVTQGKNVLIDLKGRHSPILSAMISLVCNENLMPEIEKSQHKMRDGLSECNNLEIYIPSLPMVIPSDT